MAPTGKPVVIVPAHHTRGKAAETASEDDTEDMPHKLLLMEDSAVMLTRNIWTHQGLTNDTMGKISNSSTTMLCVFIVHIIYLPDQTPFEELPTIVMVAYTVSTHKSQGMTLNKVAVELGEKDFCRGLNFVAISRGRRIMDIALCSSIRMEQLRKVGISHKV